MKIAKKGDLVGFRGFILNQPNQFSAKTLSSDNLVSPNQYIWADRFKNS